MLTESLAVGATDQPLIEKTIGDVFDDTVARWPDRGAIVSRHEGLRYTYRDLQREVNRLASALLELGLVPGDRVGVWSHNNVAWLLTQLATAKTGIILVTINPAYRVTELEYALNKSGCKMLVTMRQFKTSNYLDILLELAPELRDGIGGELHAAKLPHLRHVVWTDGVGQELDERQAWVDQSRAVRFSRLLASGNEDDPRVQELARTRSRMKTSCACQCRSTIASAW